MDETSLRFWLESPDGQETEYEVVGTFEMEGEDYMALAVVTEEKKGGPEEVTLTKYYGDEEDRIIFAPIEDDEEYERAAETFDDLFNGKIEVEEYMLMDEADLVMAGKGEEDHE